MDVESDIYKLERRLGHLERTVQSHGRLGVSTDQKVSHISKMSAERLEYIRERFDGLESKMGEDASWSKWLAGVVLSIVFAFATTVFALYIEPLRDSIKTYDRRLLDVEEALHKAVLFHGNDVDPE